MNQTKSSLFSLSLSLSLSISLSLPPSSSSSSSSSIIKTNEIKLHFGYKINCGLLYSSRLLYLHVLVTILLGLLQISFIVLGNLYEDCFPFHVLGISRISHFFKIGTRDWTHNLKVVDCSDIWQDIFNLSAIFSCERVKKSNIQFQ